MEMIYELDRIEALRDLFRETERDCIDNLLRVLVDLSEGSDTPSCIVKGESSIQYYRCDQREKIQFEISKWVAGLQSALGRDYRLLKQISPALTAVCEREHVDQAQTVLARTLRMFHLCEALFLTSVPHGNPYEHLRANFPNDIRAVIETILNTTFELGNAWHFSLALILLVAIGESQCEHFQPFAWEAYSAGRARDELLRLWPQRREVECAINLIAVLIRCQSAVGQAVRGTGSPAIIEHFACDLDTGRPSWLVFKIDERVLALKMMAIVEEARNHKLPSNNNNSDGADPRNAGVSCDWGPEEFHTWAIKYADFERNRTADAKPVYGYMRATYVRGHGHSYPVPSEDPLDERITALKATIWTTAGLDPMAPSGLNPENRNFLKQEGYWTVSFGQEQVDDPLRILLERVLEKFPIEDDNARSEYFNRCFRLDELQIPDNYSAARPRPERTLRILLRDRLTALRLVFTGAEIDDADIAIDVQRSHGGNACSLVESQSLVSGHIDENATELHESSVGAGVSEGDDGSAAWLFQYLLERANNFLDVTCSQDWGHWPARRKADDLWIDNTDRATYVPFPLVRRISEVVYRLRGKLCFSLPLAIDSRPPVWIHIPGDMKSDAERLHLILANFVLGTILNHAMAEGLDHADLDLKGLVSHNCGLAAVLAKMPETEGALQPNAWYSMIERMFHQGGYHTLLGRYVRDYNARRDIVRFLGVTARGIAVEHVTVGPALLSALDAYLRQRADVPMLMVGVDIGGTLTKIQLFLYKVDGRQTLMPIGRTFRMQTADPDQQAESAESLPVAKALQKGAQIFADRLIRQIEIAWKNEYSELNTQLNPSRNKIPVVIGLAWPGPIHDGHIAGQSNPLKLFHWPKAPRNDMQYPINDIFEVDLDRAVRNAWKREMGNCPLLPAMPFVALLNDGDSEAMGTIADGIFNINYSPRNQDGEGGLAVVKLGTGLAGGFFRKVGANFALQPGLFEWGKLVLDVGAPPKESFPQGVASEYLSQRCLPRLAKLRGKQQHCFQADDPDSGEIGRIADVSHAINNESRDDQNKKYTDLILECGARQAERSRPWQIPVSVELVRRLLEKELEIEPDLLFAMQIALKISNPTDLLDQAKKDISEYGKTRLQKLLEWPDAPHRVSPTDLNTSRALISAATVAEECICALGAYLGDFCVLLHEQLHASEVILAGGVLSGRTREIAIASARKRVAIYGLDLGEPLATGAFPLTKKIAGTSTSRAVASGTGITGSADRGTLGAAVFAAAGFVQDQKATGKQRLAACLLPLRSATEVRIEGTKVLVAGTVLRDDHGEVDFSAFALDSAELVEFMKGTAGEWGYYQSTDGSFIRWVVR